MSDVWLDSELDVEARCSKLRGGQGRSGERAAAFERRSEIEADAADEEQLRTRRASDSGN
jgi:hypothetical protein